MAPSFSMRLRGSPDVVFQTVGDEAVLLNMKTSIYLGLNLVGTRMWIVLTSAQSIQTAFESLLAEFDVTEAQLRRDLEEFIARLDEYALLAPPEEISIAPTNSVNQ